MSNFYEQRDSNAPPDGVTVICLPGRTREVPVERLPAGGGWRQLANGCIVPGSMRLTCLADPQLSCTDADLHGHSTVPGGSPLVDHVLGRVKLPVANQIYDVVYDVPNGPGRLIRQFEHDEPVTPSMMPFRGDSSHKVCWTVEYAHRLGRPVRFEGELFSHVVELHSGLRVDGKLKMNTPVLLQRMRLDSGSPDTRWGYETRLDQALARGMPHVTCKSGATELTFGKFEIDGWKQTDAFWRDVLNIDADGNPLPTPPKWNVAELRNSFQNSPLGSGLSFTTQSGRIVKDLRINGSRLHVHDMPGSCCVSDTAVKGFIEWLRIGSSFCGRPFYELAWTILRLIFEGHSRTSMARIAIGTSIEHLTYVSLGLTNPASTDAEQTSVLGVSDARGEGTVYLPNIDIDLTGSKYETGPTLGASGLMRGIVRGGGVAGIQSTSRGALKATVDMNMVGVPDGAFLPPLSTPSNESQANWAMLDLSLRYQHVATPTKMIAPLEVRVKRNASHPVGHRQNIYVTLETAAPMLGLFWIPDLASLQPQDCVPTTVWITGGTFDTRRTQIVSVNAAYDVQTWPPNIAAYPIRIRVIGARFNVLKPDTPADNTYASQFALLRLTDCETLDGRIIEPAKLIDGSWWN